MKKRSVGQILRINITVPLWAFLFIGAGVLIVSFLCAPLYREQLKFASVLIGGGAAIYSAYYVGAALRLRIERDRQRASFDILSLLNRPEFVEVRHFIEKEVEGHDNMSAKELYDKILGSNKLDDAVTIVLGIFEDASIAIQNDFADENILYASLMMLVKKYFRGLRGYIEQHREKQGSSLYFIEMEKLCTAWGSGRRLSDGEALPSLETPVARA